MSGAVIRSWSAVGILTGKPDLGTLRDTQWKIQLSTPYYLLRKDVERFLATYDQYRSMKRAV
jgi:hypothetical protein